MMVIIRALLPMLTVVSCFFGNYPDVLEEPEFMEIPGARATVQCTNKTMNDGTPFHDVSGVKYNCEFYGGLNRCAEDGNKYTNSEGMTAKAACCVCGGGDVLFPPSSLPTGCISFSTSDGSYEYEVCFDGDVTQTNTTDGDTKTIGTSPTWNVTTLSYSFENGVHAVCGICDGGVGDGDDYSYWWISNQTFDKSSMTKISLFDNKEHYDNGESPGIDTVDDDVIDDDVIASIMASGISFWSPHQPGACSASLYNGTNLTGSVVTLEPSTSPVDYKTVNGEFEYTFEGNPFPYFVSGFSQHWSPTQLKELGVTEAPKSMKIGNRAGSSSATVNFLCSRTHYTPQIAEIKGGGSASCHYDITVAWSGVCGYHGSNYYFGTSSLPLEPSTVIAPLIKRPSQCLKTTDSGFWINDSDGDPHKFHNSDPYLMICMGENATVTSLDAAGSVSTELGKYVGWTSSDNQTFTLEYRAAAALSGVKGCPQSAAYEVASDNCFCGTLENDQIPGLPLSIGRDTTCASFGCSLEEGKEECTNRCLNQTDCKSFSYIVDGNNKGFCFLYTSTCTSDCTGAGNFKSSPGYDTQSWNKNYATVKVHVFWGLEYEGPLNYKKMQQMGKKIEAMGFQGYHVRNEEIEREVMERKRAQAPRLAKVRIPEAGRCYYDIDLIWNGNFQNIDDDGYGNLNYNCNPLEKSSSNPKELSWGAKWCNPDYPRISIQDLQNSTHNDNQLPIQMWVS